MRKVVLPNADVGRVCARLIALDARLNPVHAGAAFGRWADGATRRFPSRGAPAPILVDKRNNDVWERLPDDYYRMMQESGEGLVQVQEAATAGSGWTSVQAGRLCHQRLASLPRAWNRIARAH